MKNAIQIQGGISYFMNLSVVALLDMLKGSCY